MQSLAAEIQSFSRTRLRKQCTRVTSLSGRRIIETWKGSTITVVEDQAPSEKTLGYVPDTSWDLQVGIVKPFLLLGEPDKESQQNIQTNMKASNFSFKIVLFLEQDFENNLPNCLFPLSL